MSFHRPLIPSPAVMRFAFVLLFFILIYCDFRFLYHANNSDHPPYDQIDKIPKVKLSSILSSYSHTDYAYNFIGTYQIPLFGCLLISLFSIYLSYFTENFRFVPFHHSLNSLKSYNNFNRPPINETLISLTYTVLFIFFVFEDHEIFVFSYLFTNTEFLSSWKIILRLSPYLRRIGRFFQMIIFFSFSTTSSSHTICLFAFQIFCTSIHGKTASWLPLLLIILST